MICLTKPGEGRHRSLSHTLNVQGTCWNLTFESVLLISLALPAEKIRENAPACCIAVQMDRAAMVVHDLGDDRESQTHSIFF